MKAMKIAVLGAGNVGAASAAAIAASNLGRVCLHDQEDGLAAGKAIDINEASPLLAPCQEVVACEGLEEIAGSDVVVIAAGAPRRAGMKRSDLLQENVQVVASLAAAVDAHCPCAKVLIVTNPVDALTGFVREKWPEMNAFGFGCTLDMVRFQHYLAKAAGVAVGAVRAVVIGSHDDNMVPLVSQATIAGRPVVEVLSAEAIGSAIGRTRAAGALIVSKLKTRGSFYAASRAVAAIVEAVARDARAVFPLDVPCGGHYGRWDTCLALPCVVGAGGVEVLDVRLNDDERAGLEACAREVAREMEAIRNVVSRPTPCIGPAGALGGANRILGGVTTTSR